MRRKYAGVVRMTMALSIWFIFLLTGCHSSILQKVYTREDQLVMEEATEELPFSEEADTEAMKDLEDLRIYVHVCGCVRQPGLYEFPMGARIDAAIQAAGGFTRSADQKSVNLAELLVDGIQIEVASKEESLAQSQGKAEDKSSNKTQGETQRININTADQTTLTTLNGVGESRAAAIISYRETHGRFQAIDEILQVDGIGAGIYQKIKDTIAVE